jgi:hypothetical protein
MDPFAKRTFLKDFYEHVDVAEQHSNALTFPNFIKRATTSGTGTGKGLHRLSLVSNCSFAGTFHNYETGEIRPFTRTCSKGFVSYYWLSEINSDVIDSVEKEMTRLGWTNQIDDMWRPSVKKNLLKGDFDSGYSFTRSDGTYATVTFLNRDYVNINNKACKGDRDCKNATKADKEHQYFLVVHIYAYRDYQ